MSFPDASEVNPGRVWTEAGILGSACGDKQQENGGLVGMAYTARDMIQIVDALEGEEGGGLLNYWGKLCGLFFLILFFFFSLVISASES